MADDKTNRDIEKEFVVHHAFESGGKAALGTGLVAGSIVAMAHKFSPWFNKRFSASSKTALVVMSSLAAFTYISEDLVTKGAKDPKKYIEVYNNPEKVAISEYTEKKSNLQWYHHTANYAYENPFRSIALVGTPLVGSVFAIQRLNPSISLSQKIMHTRIYGQGSIVLLLLGSMAFHDWMEKRGKFE